MQVVADTEPQYQLLETDSTADAAVFIDVASISGPADNRTYSLAFIYRERSTPMAQRVIHEVVSAEMNCRGEYRAVTFVTSRVEDAETRAAVDLTAHRSRDTVSTPYSDEADIVCRGMRREVTFRQLSSATAHFSLYTAWSSEELAPLLRSSATAR